MNGVIRGGPSSGEPLAESNSDSCAVGGIILCGGLSNRMGRPKAWLPFGTETMLQRVVRLVAQVADPLVVVAAVGQSLPALPSTVAIVRDQRPERGPLEGLCAGLTALDGRAAAAFVTSCDVPLLVPAVVRMMVRQLGEFRAAVPADGDFCHPLAAVYRIDVLPEVRALLAADRLRLQLLLDRVSARRVPVAMLRELDPALLTLANLNTPAEYAAAVRRAACDAPFDTAFGADLGADDPSAAQGPS